MAKKLAKASDVNGAESRAGEIQSRHEEEEGRYSTSEAERAAWIARLSRTDTAPLVTRFPGLENKLDDAYLVQGWSGTERLAALVNHYDFFSSVLPAKVLYSLYHDDLLLLQLTDPTGQRLRMKLMLDDRFMREGELTLLFQSTSADEIVARFTFTVIQVQSLPVIVVGGQGWRPTPDPAPDGKSFTCADTAFLAWRCLCCLSRTWQIGEIRAVTDLYRIRNLNSLGALLPRFDIFWADQGATHAGAWAWELPLDQTTVSKTSLQERLDVALTAALTSGFERQTWSETPVVACTENDLRELKPQHTKSRLCMADMLSVNRSL